MDPADTPPYFPVGGPYTIAFGMPFDLNQNGAPANSVFQLDDEFGEYLESKTQARSEELDKYFCTADYSEGKPRQVAQFIVSRLVREYPRDPHKGSTARSLRMAQACSSLGRRAISSWDAPMGG